MPFPVSIELIWYERNILELALTLSEKYIESVFVASEEQDNSKQSANKIVSFHALFGQDPLHSDLYYYGLRS